MNEEEEKETIKEEPSSAEMIDFIKRRDEIWEKRILQMEEAAETASSNILELTMPLRSLEAQLIDAHNHDLQALIIGSEEIKGQLRDFVYRDTKRYVFDFLMIANSEHN